MTCILGGPIADPGEKSGTRKTRHRQVWADNDIVYRSGDPARRSCPSDLLDFDPCPTFFIDCDLERSVDRCALSYFRMVIASAWRPSPDSCRADYSSELVDHHRACNLAGLRAGRRSPAHFRAA